MKGTFCILIVSCFTCALGQSKLSRRHEQQYPISLKFGAPVKANAPATIEKARFVQESANRNNAGGPLPKIGPEPNNANTKKVQNPSPPRVIKVKQPKLNSPANSNPSPNQPEPVSTNNNSPAQPKPTPQQTSPSNPSPKNVQKAVSPVADQSNLGNAQKSPVPTASAKVANSANNPWFGANVPEQLSGIARLLMMPEQYRERILRLGALIGNPSLFPTPANNNIPGSPSSGGISPTNSTGNSSNAMNPLNNPIGNMIQRQMELQEAGLEIQAVEIPIICKGIVAPAPGNETVQQLKADGMKAALTAFSLGKELSYMEGAALCHNKLKEYQACDIYSNVMETTCQPNFPNQCKGGMKCSIYSGMVHDLLGVIPLCCPKTVLEARQKNMLHETGMLPANLNMPLIR
ncbi:translation initiation factor IF-2-like isoform X2 [Ostrea edulis]|uniref:translation initiation factor IF-2-like isoform X2 n=1 Tax=Ostrea edulis TaxID=37623 RepID=UPI0020965E48|nr:translation initiation factor IF-2-like isoform X2 [Ostrea edulis]